MSPWRASIVLAGAALALGLACFAYGFTGLPLRWLVRGHLGDVAAAAAVYAVLGLVVPTRRAARAAVTAVVAVVVELAQRHGDPGAGTAGELLLGAHFDPWDLLAYGLGITAAVAWDRQARARAEPSTRALDQASSARNASISRSRSAGVTCSS